MAAEEVKYLSFIQRSAESIYGYAEAGYAKMKDLSIAKLPNHLQELFESVEERLKPVLGSVIVPYSLSVLHFCDNLVRFSCARRCLLLEGADIGADCAVCTIFPTQYSAISII